VKGGRRDAMLDCKVDGAAEDIGVVIIHTENEAAVDHDSQAMEPFRYSVVVAARILPFVAPGEIGRGERFQSDKKTAQASLGRFFDEIAGKNRIDRRSALEQTVHAAQTFEERARESAVAQQMIVEEVKVPAGRALDFGKRVVDALRIEGTAALEKRILIAEVAVMGTSE
jgi:hypothetical protein